MSKQIWNEGRVVGYSAYEVYVRQHLLEDPDTPPASEKEWLASSIAMGSSMIMRVPTQDAESEDEHHFVDIMLPPNSNLASANTIIASFFDGDCTWQAGANRWAGSVTNYGQLISSSITGHKYANSSIATNQNPLNNMSKAKLNMLKDYMKIVDGVVIHPGEWSASDPKLTPDLTGSSAYPRIRLQIKGKTTTQPLVLLTGFTIRSVLQGVTKFEGSDAPQDGDFLGPGSFPWSNKIVFSVPTSYIAYFMSNAYKRKLPADSKDIIVNDTSVIDMRSKSQDGVLSNPVLEKYYSTPMSTDSRFYHLSGQNKAGSRVSDDVKDFNTTGEGVSVLTVYEKKSIYPPALYGTYVNETGQNYLHPIDIVAPGSVKMFYNDDGSNMKDYQDTFPGTTAMNETTDGMIELLDPSKTDGSKVPVAKVTHERIKLTQADGTTINSNAYQTRVTTGKQSSLMLSTDGATLGEQTKISRANTRTQVSTDSDYGDKVMPIHSETWGADNLTWQVLLSALANDKGIDILQDRLKDIKDTILRSQNSGVGPYITFGPASNPIRLYISKNVPETANVPIGSIGIGWGFDQD